MVDRRMYGNMTLEQLRGHLQEDALLHKKLNEKALRKGEEELKEDIKRLKKEKQESQAMTAKRSQEMVDLLLFAKKCKTLHVSTVTEEAKIKAEIAKHMNTKKGKAQMLEFERLAAEWKDLRCKEEDLVKEITRLQGEITKHEVQLGKERGESKDPLVRLRLNQEEKSVNGVFMGRIRKLKERKTGLEKEREEAMKDFELIKSGDINNSRWLQSVEPVPLDRNTKEQLISERLRINKLRQDLRATKNEYLPPDYLSSNHEDKLPVVQDGDKNKQEIINSDSHSYIYSYYQFILK
eukprot:TRINITY_DN18814_c0_g2_i2.p1 TRINITY_DN18814_c0_g2~~TRINITY_DN18814_c0_g2_i2.p1  ORF type:complete len:294 (+),score=90.82 TRINITY_DN18814_c0_g2_i2:431-1312(+)